VSFDRSQRPADLFETVVWKLKPALPKSGGVSLPGFIVTVPDGTSFYGLKYHGDLSGWQNQIERGAASLGLSSAKIQAEMFVVLDGRSYPLSQCTVERDIEAIKSGS
jgi:hypothetical protein